MLMTHRSMATPSVPRWKRTLDQALRLARPGLDFQTTGANDDNKGAAHETKDSSNDSKPAASQDNGKKDNASNGKKDSPRKARQNTKRNKGGSN